MTSREIHPYQATGDLVLESIHFGGGATDGAENIMAMRWRDTGSGNRGRSSHVRLALYVERGGKIFVEADGNLLPAVVTREAPFVHTEGHDGGRGDPILKLPTY